jgi:uncharacterized membrane protein YoaK (UPF0700 family)
VSSAPTRTEATAAAAPTAAERRTAGLMLALTFSTGIVDATGYVGLDRVFTGNMTGNVVILGMALVGGDHLPVVGPVIALAGFALGAVGGGRALRAAGSGWRVRSTAVFAVVGVLLAVIAALAAITGGGRSGIGAQYLLTAVLGLAMGGQAASARQVGVKDVTTVVVTSTLTGLFADSRLGGRVAQPWVRRAVAVVLIALGAVVGAACVHVQLWIGPALAAAITLAVASYGHRAAAA